MDNTSYEQHPHLPSGYWTGFYVYAHEATRHEMLIMLDFINGIITGSGSDDVSAFTFQGSYQLDAMTCQFMKHYATHSIDYRGHIDENGIWGKWHFVYDSRMGIDKEIYDIVSRPWAIRPPVDFTSGPATKNSPSMKWSYAK